MLPIDQLAQKVGRKVLFVGTEAYRWTVADFSKAAKNARALGVDTLCIKRADGGIKWYQTAGHLALERQACLSEGVGFVPFMYNYGPHFGDTQILLEANVAIEMMDTCDGLVCLDLEVEWNGNGPAAQRLCDLLKPASARGDIIVSTWADPVQQNWVGVIQALNPVVSAWGPQEYTNWLSAQELQFTEHGVNANKLWPELDITHLYSYNTPLTVFHDAVTRGHGSIWLWEYQVALRNPGLVHTLFALLGPTTSAPDHAPVMTNTTKVAPVDVPVPSHTAIEAHYVIKEGDTLGGIASALHLSNWFTDLYVPNHAVLDRTAQQHGYRDSERGNIIFPGTLLTYTRL